MSTVLIKEELHKYIDKGDEKLLKLIYVLIREYQHDELSVTDIAELENRTAKRKSGKSKTYNLQQTRDMITGKVAINP
jgi:hypothetical protein